MKLEDYLHLYLGSWITTHHSFRPNPRESVGKSGFAKLTPCLLADIDEKIFPFTPKLVLRRLADMTELEQNAFGILYPEANIWSKRHYLLLLSNGFDIFGLIEADLAIDKKTIQ